MDGMGLVVLGVWAARVEAESARPWARVVARCAPGAPDGLEVSGARRTRTRRPGRTRDARPHRARAARPRRALAGGLHHLADVIAPASGTLAHDGVGRPAR